MTDVSGPSPDWALDEIDYWRDRADEAEFEIKYHWRPRAEKAEAALARVHDELDRANELRMFGDVFKRIRSATAIEGEQQ